MPYLHGQGMCDACFLLEHTSQQNPERAEIPPARYHHLGKFPARTVDFNNPRRVASHKRERRYHNSPYRTLYSILRTAPIPHVVYSTCRVLRMDNKKCPDVPNASTRMQGCRPSALPTPCVGPVHTLHGLPIVLCDMVGKVLVPEARM